ncbi:MAG TPA: response regulator [Candidatus Limnocylindria bacterium]|nr:response regulator [Candidatus Limnocylindria bacterium]
MPARILLVGDETVQKAAADVLGAESHELSVCTNGQQAVERWAAEHPDLLIIDSALPGLPGDEVVRRIRENEARGAHVPIVLLGEVADIDAKVRGLRLGADDYLAKPIHPVELSARVRGLLVRYVPVARPQQDTPQAGKVLGFYGAKGGVGTTTLAINSAIALRRVAKRSVALVDGNLQFGDHRVFLDLGTDRRSIVDVVSAHGFDQDLLRRVVVRHDSGVDLLLAPNTPESAEHVSAEQHHLLRVVEVLRTMYDYVLVDLDKRLDDHTLDVISIADDLFVVMTADLSCLKNVRLVLETMAQIGLPEERMQLVLNRANAFTGISLKAVENVLRRPIVHQVMNDYRVAIGALNSGAPFMMRRGDSAIAKGVVDFVKAIDDEPAQARRAPSFKLQPARG